MAKTHKEHDEEQGNGHNHKGAGEFRSGPVAGTTMVYGVTFYRKALQYAEVDGLAMFEGDIILGTVADAKAMADAAAADEASLAGAGPVLASVGITGTQFRWPNATIPYDFEAGFPNQQRVTDAIAHWQANTRIRFVLRTAANASQFPDFVRFVNGGGCSSNVGRRGGQQTITLGPTCSTGNAIHEIGHTVGLWHEQSREDRDTFVRIVWANIDPAMAHNFDQHISDGDDLGAYDYGSIMHYPPTAFSTNGQATIVALRPLPPGVVMGQRTALSAGDIAGVAAMYPTSPVTIKELRKDPITDPTIKETWKEPTLDGTAKEVRKDPIHDPTIKEVFKDPISDGTNKEVRKDPIQDPTIKEVARDPIGTLVENIRLPGGGRTPFVMSGFSNFAGGGADPNADLAAQVQALGEALVAVQQQLAEVSAAYDALVQSLGGAQGGGG